MAEEAVRRSSRRPGKLLPSQAKRLRGRSLALKPGRAMAWHSTGSREELLMILTGRLQLELRARTGRRALALVAGQCAFIPQDVVHRMVNRSRRPARYLYLTG